MPKAEPRTGLVVARQRRRIEIQTPNGARSSCIARGRDLHALCGDRVLWRREPDGTCVVTEVLPRQTLLTRVDKRGRPEPVAANLTQLAAVVAAEPVPAWPLLDRYLAAAELMRVRVLIVYNKCDLAAPPARLAGYTSIGYALLETSALHGRGLAALTAALAGHRSALLGASGVGKSSLVNALVGDTVQTVGELGKRRTHGRHTTTTAVLYTLETGGELVDTPGVRQYAPYIDEHDDVARGFREFRAYLGLCRFDDCRHRAEPGCAVKAAVSTDAIAPERYASYLSLLDLVDG